MIVEASKYSVKSAIVVSFGIDIVIAKDTIATDVAVTIADVIVVVTIADVIVAVKSVVDVRLDSVLYSFVCGN